MVSINRTFLIKYKWIIFTIFSYFIFIKIEIYFTTKVRVFDSLSLKLCSNGKQPFLSITVSLCPYAKPLDMFLNISVLVIFYNIPGE